MPYFPDSFPSQSVLEDVLSRVAKLADEFCRELSEFDPAFYSSDECASLAAVFARVVNACGAAQARAVLRASVSARPEKFLSEMNGSNVGAARDALRAASSVDSGTELEQALRSGEISPAQAAEIVKAPAVHHDELTALARGSALQPVRDEARRRTLAAIPPKELHKKQHEAMKFRHWQNDLGNVEFKGELPPEIGVPWINRLDRAVDRAWRKVRNERSREHVAAEVLVNSTGENRENKTDVVFVLDINAFRRGHAHHGEPCHIIGGGPIPVDIVREMVKDAFVKAVLHDGVNVHTVKHFGRRRPAVLQTILDLGPPPDFTGASCKECGRKYNLQWDHIDPVANGGPTCYTHAQALCIPDHVAKTERDRKAGLLGRRPQGP